MSDRDPKTGLYWESAVTKAGLDGFHRGRIHSILFLMEQEYRVGTADSDINAFPYFRFEEILKEHAKQIRAELIVSGWRD